LQHRSELTNIHTDAAMFFSKLISKDVQEFIRQNINSDLIQLLLKKSPFADVTMAEIVQQIKGRKTAEKIYSFLIFVVLK